MSKQTIQGLIQNYLGNSLTADELSLLLEQLRQQEGETFLLEAIHDSLIAGSTQGQADKVHADRLFEGILRAAGESEAGKKIGAGQEKQVSKVIRPDGWQGRRLFRALSVAAVLLLIAAGIFFFYTAQRHTDKVAIGNKKIQDPADIAPGHSTAILTLSDGSQVTLDSAGNGMLALQGNHQVVKTNGQLSYEGKGDNRSASGPSLVYNTLSTPRGGQYQLLLPDGTKVWLNAASSITYPVGAMTKKMAVKIEGEVYFEVAKNKEMPFIVDIGGRSTVEVLGTHFNVNGYTNEGTIRTTLLEGSVKVTSGQNDKVLRPGQQSEQAAQDQKITVHNDVDTGQVLAWKNGLFDFEGASLPAVMHQLERWYDITVQYEGSVPAIEFRGGMDRNVNLSAILQFLTEMKIKYTMQGRTLIISK